MSILDTNVISELRKGKANQAQQVRAWASELPVSQLYLSAITVMEMELGTQQMERRDAPQGVVLRRCVERILAEFEGRVLAFTGGRRCCAPGCTCRTPARFETRRSRRRLWSIRSRS